MSHIGAFNFRSLIGRQHARENMRGAIGEDLLCGDALFIGLGPRVDVANECGMAGTVEVDH